MKFPYPKMQFGIRFMMLLGLLGIFVYLLTVPKVDSNWLTGIVIASYLALALASATPLFTAHEMVDDGFRLRQGVLFDTMIPFSDIESVSEVYTKIWAMGVLPIGAIGRIVLATSNRNLVSIKLKSKRRFSMLLWRSSREIIIDLVNPAEFIRAANDRLKR